MAQLKHLTTGIVFTHDISHIVTALQQLSVLEMQQIRDRVLTTRTHMDTLLDIFIDVRLNYERLVTKKLKATPPRPTTALVMLSQNARFSDTNAQQVFTTLVNESENYPRAEVIMVGAVAQQFATQAHLDRTHTVKIVNVPDHVKSTDDLSALFELLAHYQQIFVFHGDFKNLVNQDSAVTELNGRDTLLQAEEQVAHQKRNFLYEPQLEKVIAYFEQEVKKGLLLQMSNESRLAHLGSRIQNLEQSRVSIEEQLKKLSNQYRQEDRRVRAKKQQQRLAGRSLWS